MHRFDVMFSRSRRRTYDVLNRRLDKALQSLHYKFQAAQAQVMLLAAAAATAGGRAGPSSECSLLPSFPNRTSPFILAFLFLPYAQIKLHLFSCRGLVSLPSPGWQLWGGKMKGQSRLFYERRLLHGCEWLPTQRVHERSCVRRLQPLLGTAGGILKSISSSNRHHSQAALFGGNT